jgi:hypothetical protein
MQRYAHLFSVNMKTSHYLQSKVFRAKEALDSDNPEEHQKWRDENSDAAKQSDEMVRRRTG